MLYLGASKHGPDRAEACLMKAQMGTLYRTAGQVTLAGAVCCGRPTLHWSEVLLYGAQARAVPHSPPGLGFLGHAVAQDEAR